MTTLLTLQQVADDTGIPIATLYELCAPKGDLPVVRIGRGRKQPRIYVQRTDLEAWIAKRRVAPAPAREQPIARAVTRRSISDLPGWDRYTH